MTNHEREIEEVLRAVYLRYRADHPRREADMPELLLEAMARAVVEQAVGPLAIPYQRHGCMWEAHEDCEAALADRDTHLARLTAALKGVLACVDDGVLVRNITNDAHFPSYVAQGSRIVSVLKAAQDALADAGAGKERGDETA